MMWFSRTTAYQAFGQDWSSYTLLLGGSFAAAALAKVITTSQAANGGKAFTSAASSRTAGPATTAAGHPRLGDLSCNDSGDLSLADTQYCVFSMVAIMYFVGAFVAEIIYYANANCQTYPADCRGVTLALPAIPPVLLGLTSLAAFAYVAAKAVTSAGGRLSLPRWTLW
jgi:hypothetical protein